MGTPVGSTSHYMQVFCSWNNSSKNIRDSMKIRINDSSKLALDDIVDLETCIQLFANDDSPCTINFKMEKNYAITSLSIVSDAKLFELYGQYEEYIGTYHAEYMDVFEDMAVYLMELDLPFATECSLKLAKMKEKKSMWVYGIYVTVCEGSPASSKFSMDLNKVEERLKVCNQPITNKALKCKEFVKMYKTYLPTLAETEVADPILLLKLLEGQFLSCLLSETESESTNQNSNYHRTSILAKNSHFQTASTSPKNSPSSTQESTHCSENDFLATNPNFKYYVDEKFLMLENKLTATINCRLKSIEEKYAKKVDKILSILEKSNYVPQ